MTSQLRRFIVSVLASIVGALCFVPIAGAAPMVLKISHQFPANTDFRDQVARRFAQEVEKRTNGEVKFQIYAGASLYKPTQQFDALSSGSLDMSVYPLAYSGGKLPATNLTLMPGADRELPASLQLGKGADRQVAGRLSRPARRQDHHLDLAGGWRGVARQANPASRGREGA